jgi:hypothetical protein
VGRTHQSQASPSTEEVEGPGHHDLGARAADRPLRKVVPLTAYRGVDARPFGVALGPRVVVSLGLASGIQTAAELFDRVPSLPVEPSWYWAEILMLN